MINKAQNALLAHTIQFFNRAIRTTFGCPAILEKFDHAVSVAEHAHHATPPSLLKFVSAPYFSSTHIQVLNFKIEISAAQLQIL